MKRKSLVFVLLILTLAFMLASCDGIANKKPDSLQILSGAPTEVLVGATPDFSEIQVKVTYNDGEEKTVGYSDVTISEVDTSKVGDATYTVSYGGASVSATIKVKSSSSSLSDVTLTGITYLSGIPTELFVGGEFHTTDLRITAHYSDGTVKTVTSDKLTVVQNIDNDVVGEQKLIVEYEKQRCEIKINVKAVLPESLSLVANTFSTDVLIGSDLDTSAITGILRYNNGKTEPIANASLRFEQFNTASAGTKELVAKYGSFSAKLNVTVYGISTIDFTGFKTTIKYNETLDLSALAATVTATNGKKFTVPASKITVDKTNFDQTLNGTDRKTTKIAFSYCGASKEYTINVTAEKADATLSELKLAAASNVKTTIFVGEAFNDAGIRADAIYTFGYTTLGLTKANLTPDYSKLDNTTAGEYKVTYSYTDGGVTKSFDLTVTVEEPTATGIELNTSDLGYVIKGEELNVSGITATLKYNYAGKTDALTNAELTITGVDTTAAGDFTVTVKYGDFTATATYKVVTAVEITVVHGIDTAVPLGTQAYESADVEVEILLSNGVTVERTLESGVTIDESAYNATVVGNTTLTVKFGDVQKEITVQVLDQLDELVLQGIQIQASSLPVTEIFAGQAYDHSNIKIVATYTYGITRVYTLATGVTVTTRGTTEQAGEYVITASFTHEGVTKTADFTVTVKEVLPVGIQISGEYEESILLGDAFDKSAITATLYYNNDTDETIANADLTITIDVSVAGVSTLTVAYGDFTDTKEITVVGIESVVFVGLKTHYRLNEAINTEGIQIKITGTDTREYIREYKAEYVTLPTLTIDGNKVKEEAKEYTFTYLGKEYKQTITVYAEFADAQLISIEYTGAKEAFKGDSLTISIKAYYTYGFVMTYDADDGVTSDFSSAVLGTHTVTVTYQDKTVTTSVEVVMPKVTNIVINNAPIGILNENYDYNAVNVTLTLENNKTVQSTLENLVDYGITASVDVTTAGVKALTLTANGKNYTKDITVYEIANIKIDTTGYTTIIQVGSTFSTEGLGTIHVYLKGLQEPIIRQVTEFNHNVNTAVKNSYTLTTTYLGVTSDAVTITVTDQEFVITGAEYPSSINAWINKTYSSKFLDSGYAYVVGDDNPFKFEINFQLFDVINEVPKSSGLAYTSQSTVTLNGEVVGEEYVTIDETKHTFDFTEAAVGKTFVITTTNIDATEYTKSLTVTVVDAYNVSEAIELNLLTNYNSELASTGKHMLDLLYPFLYSNNVAGMKDKNMDFEQYYAFVNNIKGIVIHNNLTLKYSDFPTDYFFTTSSGEKYLWDHQSVFYRVFRELKLNKGDAPAVFNMYGNYFTVISNNIPIVAPNGTTDKNGVKSNDDDGLSSSDLFRFNISADVFNEAFTQNKFYVENYVYNIYALGIHDNDPSVPVQSELAQIRSKLGVIGFKFAQATYNLKAVNAESYFNTAMCEYDDIVVNFDYCSFYNAWNNHISTWTSNTLDEGGNGSLNDGMVHDGYTPCTINITNSFMGKCGGPVILNMNKQPTAEFNVAAGSKATITIDENSNIFSYVKGTESWFVAYGATSFMQPVMGLWVPMFEANESYLATTINGNKFLNMIAITMDASFNPGTLSGVTTDVDGQIFIGDDAKLDMNDWSYEGMNFNYGHGGTVDGILWGAQAQGATEMPPIFMTDAGGATYTDNVNLYPAVNKNGEAFEGDYLSIYLYNLGILVGFNESTLTSEPAPADCTVVKITTLHGYAE